MNKVTVICTLILSITLILSSCTNSEITSRIVQNTEFKSEQETKPEPVPELDIGHELPNEPETAENDKTEENIETVKNSKDVEYEVSFPVWVTVKRLDVRQKPSSKSKKLHSLYKHEEVEVIGKNGSWYIIVTDGIRGYCKADSTTKKRPSIKLSSPYLLKVNRLQNMVIVYEKDSNGEFTVPKKAMVCSTGKDNKTPCGIFSIGAKYKWLKLAGGVYGQYATWIVGDIAFHSVPYFSKHKDDLEYEEFNKLGTHASLGCVRMCVSDVKWIYENVPKGTTVIIYDSEESEPLTKPIPPKIDVEDPYKGWDPTDPAKPND